MTILEKLGHWGPASTNCPNTPKYHETGITKPSDSFDTSIRPRLMWNVKLEILDYFPCVPAHDLGYLGPVSPNCPNV